jgi:hypothetical protein
VYYQKKGRLYFYLEECNRELTLDEFIEWLREKSYPELRKYEIVYRYDDGFVCPSSLEEMLLIIVRYYMVKE